MRRMYSEKQLKKLISEYSGVIIKASNIKNLNDEQCDELKCGDIVAKKTGNQYHCYVVTYKEDKHGLCLSYFDASCIETQSYDYTDGHWVYNSEDKIVFADIGGLPEVTSTDNGKVLEVIAGTWSLGGKKVRIMPAPESYYLSNAQREQIVGGAFLDGEFLGYKNMIFFPGITSGNTSYGYCLGLKSTSPVVVDFVAYNINAGNQVYVTVQKYLNIAVKSINNKDYPDYPADTEIGQFIFRKGSLKWYKPISVTGITSGDDLAGIQNDLVNAMKDHLDVMINGHMCRFEKDDGSYVMYSWKDEADGGANLQINMISLLIASPNTISFNLMKFTPTT